MPYIVIHEAISILPEPAFPQLDDAEGHVVEQVQIDLWEEWREDNGQGPPAHSYTLPDALAQELRAPQLAAPPNQVSGVRLIDGPARFIQVEDNVLHHAYTVEVHRVLTRS